MIRQFSLAIVPLVFFATVAHAGTIQGKISGASGPSVVYVDAIQGKTFPPPTEHALVTQQGLAFHPQLLVVQSGTIVDFENDDSVQHNVFWPSVGGNKKESHNLGTWPKGDKRSYKFTATGVVPLLCNVHPEMSGYIVVSPTPYYTQVDNSGNYRIDNVPDGKYQVVAWHQGEKPESKPVTVSGRGEADFTFSR